MGLIPLSSSTLMLKTPLELLLSLKVLEGVEIIIRLLGLVLPLILVFDVERTESF